MVRITAILLFATCLKVSAMGTGNLITLSKKNAPLQEIFLEIYHQSGYYFICKDNLLDNAKNVDIQVKDASLEEVLTICFKNQSLDYTISDHVIVVSKKAVQTIFNVVGTVTNEKEEPLPGAAVLIKGTHIGTETDSKGNFEIKSENKISDLDISYTGYQARTVTVHDGQRLMVQLVLSTNPFDQIQVIAYGTTSRKLNTGDVSSVNAQTIAEQPISNPLAALEGRAAGLIVTQQTGVPGGSFNVQIRGQNSIFNGNIPFYVIDGVPFTGTSINSNLVGTPINGGGSSFSNIDPSDIESIDILKDADATAIYGSRGANGVILITTKKGKIGKSTFDFNISTGVGAVTRMMPLLSTPSYLAMRHEAFANDGVTPDPAYDFDVTVWDTIRNNNWQKELIGGHSGITNVQVNFSGGDINNQYILGGSYYGTSTVFPGDFTDQKISTHFGINHTSNDRKFKLSFSGNYVIDHNNLPTFDPTNSAVTLSPDAPVGLTPTGQVNWENGTFGLNPYQYLLQPYRSDANNLISNLTTSYTLLKGLDIKANLGYNHMQVNESSETPVSVVNPVYGLTTGSTLFSNQTLSSWIAEPQVEYKRNTPAGTFNLLMGLTFQQNLQKGENLNASGFTNDAFLDNIGAAAQITALNSKDIQYRYESFFARVNYNWQDKYILNLTGRRDGSSRFGPGNQFSSFGALGAAWIFTNEQWWKNLSSFITFGKVRASYGITGNDQIGDYRYLDSWSPTGYTYQGMAGLQPSWLANPDFGWEKNKKSEVGLELGFWKERILFTGSYYVNTSSDQLILYTLPGISGFSYIVKNSSATVRNSGLEFNFSITNIKTKDFSWQANLNLTIPKNILLSYPNLTTSPYANTYVVGKSLSILTAYHYAGVNPQTGIYNFASKDPANPTYPDDLQALKQTDPRSYGGIQNNFTYKKWRLSIFFQYVDQQGFNYLRFNPLQPGMMGNQPQLVENHWTKPGDQASSEKFSQNYGDSYTAYTSLTYSSDQVVTDASFVRLKTLDLSYSFSGNWMKKMKLGNLRLFIQGQNLLTITHYQGMDPENQSLSILPPLKVIMGGFQCTF